MDQVDNEESLEPVVSLVLLVKRECLADQDHKGREDHLEHLESQETQDHQDLQVLRVYVVPEAQLVNVELLALRDLVPW